MYQNLRRALPAGAPESVHFTDIPEAEAAQVGRVAGSCRGGAVNRAVRAWGRTRTDVPEAAAAQAGSSRSDITRRA